MAGLNFLTHWVKCTHFTPKNVSNCTYFGIFWRTYYKDNSRRTTINSFFEGYTTIARTTRPNYTAPVARQLCQAIACLFEIELHRYWITNRKNRPIWKGEGESRRLPMCPPWCLSAVSARRKCFLTSYTTLPVARQKYFRFESKVKLTFDSDINQVGCTLATGMVACAYENVSAFPAVKHQWSTIVHGRSMQLICKIRTWQTW